MVLKDERSFILREQLVEVFILTILSIFAFLGAIHTILYLFCIYKSTFTDKGIKLILYLPPNFSSKLEGIVGQIFYENILRKLMTDGKIYLLVSYRDEELMRMLEKLKKMYPIEVLPEQISYCMITERENTDLK
ncbi:MAG: hypothetical protein ACOYIF_01415 [Acetivibrionales bacterium]|jgi:hypothetical protein